LIFLLINNCKFSQLASSADKSGAVNYMRFNRPGKVKKTYMVLKYLGKFCLNKAGCT